MIVSYLYKTYYDRAKIGVQAECAAAFSAITRECLISIYATIEGILKIMRTGKVRETKKQGLVYGRLDELSITPIFDEKIARFL